MSAPQPSHDATRRLSQPRPAGPRVLPRVLPFLLALVSARLAAQSPFVIEAEDFNYSSGQHRAVSDTMPYYGGAYAGAAYTAVFGTDYQYFNGDGVSDEYRAGESPNVPMNGNGDLNRGAWDVTVNYKLGWIGDADVWFNYTRSFPSNYYRVYAALSYGDAQAGQLRGHFDLVTSDPGLPGQSHQTLGTCTGRGTGSWGVNALVPMLDTSGKAAIIQLGGVKTIRFYPESGDVDYLKFVVAGPPRILAEPADTTVTENRPAIFSVATYSDDPVAYQWQSNRVNLPGATASNYTFTPRLADSGAAYRCVLTNSMGGVTSREARLTIVRDTVPPRLAGVLNLGRTQILLAFDEAVVVPAGPASASFSLDNGAAVTSARATNNPAQILLAVTPLTFGVTYTVTVSNVADIAASPVPIAPGSTIQFLASELAPTPVGAPSQPGSLTRLGPDRFDLTGGGTDIGGTADQFQFAWEQRTGDFDVQVRVASAAVTDPFMRAGLITRDSLDAPARFAGVFAAAGQLGCFFEARDAPGAAATVLSTAGGFPANAPQTWLRLRRAGNLVYGFASLDGRTWTQLGVRSFASLPATLYFGLAVASGTAAQATTAEFRDYGATASTLTAPAPAPTEPLAPSNRSSGMVISEIMYHPPARTGGRNLEFIELYNAGYVPEDLGGWQLSGSVAFTFPAGLVLAPGSFLLLAANPADLGTVLGLANVLGPYAGDLPDDAGTLDLANELGAVRLHCRYSDRPPWCAAADGAGHSLVLARPSYGEDNPAAWAASELIGGSPGRIEAVYSFPQRAAVINELLAHTDDPQLDFIEVYNPSNLAIDLSGCVLTDDPATNRFLLPTNSVIAPRGFLAFDQARLGFALNSAGETVYLIHSNLTRVLDAVRFGAQENGVAFGRSPDGADTLRRLVAPTFGAANAPWRIEDIVINELMYNPISGDADDEYIELINRGPAPRDLSGWRFVDGVEFALPPGTTLGSGACLVVARNADHLRAQYPQLDATNTVGDYQGSLANTGERVAFARPDRVVSTNDLGLLVTNTHFVVVAEVTYGTGGRWGRFADGGGSSLELIDPRADPLRPSNWADSDETAKAPWTTLAFTGPIDNGNGGFQPDRLFLGLLGPGECLADDIEVSVPGGANLVDNPGFETGSGTAATGWDSFGNHSTSTAESGTAATGRRCLHLRATGDSDTGPNTIRTPLAAGLTPGGSVTLRARVRWLAGWPEFLLRLHGNWAELQGRMPVPANLGSPGLPNSRRVANAGPAIYAVSHAPAVPRASQAVAVTCRVSDPDGLKTLRLRYRLDPASNLTSLDMTDSGLGGDAVAGDGIYSATLPGPAAGTLVAFRIEATDNASSPASSVFPANAPAAECLVRWDDPIPFGTFRHYHLWSTAATESARGNGLDNTYRDATLVCGNTRVLYNVGFRDKGSPFHGGRGDFAVTVPSDDLLLGTQDRVFAATGNGGPESSGLRGQVAGWIARQLGIPYLNATYIRLYRNGAEPYNVMEDLEQPSHPYAEAWFPGGGEGDLYKVAVWFEFADDNSGFGAVGATLEPFTTTGNAYKLARYRWTFQRRSNDGFAGNYTNLFNLIAAANTPDPTYVPALFQEADLEQWMRVFGYHRLLGNWDSYTFAVGQNMFAYRRPGYPFVLMPWDIDFVLGIGNGPADGLWGGQDPVANRMYDTPAFRRALWRLYLDAVAGPMLEARYEPQIDLRHSILARNGITGLGETQSINDYIDQRRGFLAAQITANDTTTFAITSNNGNDITTAQPLVTLAGAAPFAARTLTVNGTPYPVTWTGFNTWSTAVPLAARTNRLVVQAYDTRNQPLPGFSDTITITYTGTLVDPVGNVVLNEIDYNPAVPGTSFVELFNRSLTQSFDLSNWRLEGTGFTFTPGRVLGPNAYLLVVADLSAFTARYGPALPVAGEFPGQLGNRGETLRLFAPGTAPGVEILIDEVRYSDRLPWPAAADGAGPSLQLIDSAQDNWRVGNWSVTATNAANRTTPGALNAVRATVPAYPPLWINEVLPNNTQGLADAAGERDPWIEIANAGASPLNLAGYYLTDSYTNLTAWRFPAATVLPPRSFLLVWADGQTNQNTSTELHASFRLNPTNGSVALGRVQNAVPVVMDYLDYDFMSPNRSFGSYPDGQPQTRRLFHYPTPASTNIPAAAPVQVVFNEWMAGNSHTFLDPADQDPDDWFELYNAGNEPADLGEYTLTDTLTDISKFSIPHGVVIPPRGYLLVWADEETGQFHQTNDLHVNFRLNLGGEALGLFAPDGSMVDALTFPAQTNAVAQGRWPDGALPPFLFMEFPTPRGPNTVQAGNRPPMLDPIGDFAVQENQTLTFTAAAIDADQPPQALTFSLLNAPPTATIDAASGAFAWTPTEAEGPGSFRFTVLVTDDGSPPRSAAETLTVAVSEVNRAPVLDPIPPLALGEGSLLLYTNRAADPDLPANHLTFSLDPGAPDGCILDPVTGVLSWIPTEPQGPGSYTITVRVTDNGSPALSATATTSVRVDEVDNPPQLDPVANGTVSEGRAYAFTAHAVDSDSPPAVIRYRLAPGAPVGAHIDPLDGAFAWTPGEADGPGDFTITVLATEQTPAALTASRTFTLHVVEVNLPPALDPIPDQVVTEGATLVVTATASDPDLPAQRLTYAIASAAEPGLAVDPATGRLTWTVDPDQGAATNPVTIRVTDSGSPPLSGSRTFAVVVRPQPHVVINEILYKPRTANASFVELYNGSARTTENLDGVRLVGRTLNAVLPPGTALAPGAFLVLARNAAAYTAAYPGSRAPTAFYTGDLDPAGDVLQLLRPRTPPDPDQLLDAVAFSARLPWPADAASAGASLQLIDPTRDNVRPANWAARASAAPDPRRTLLVMTNTWRYSQSGQDLGTAWRDPAYDDSAWPAGPALLYKEDAALPAPKNTPLQLGPRTFYFRTHFLFFGPTNSATLRLTSVVDDGFLAFLNGAELFRLGLDTPVVANGTFATRTVGDAVFEGPFSRSAELLRQGDNVLAVEVHQINDTSSDIVFGLEVTVEGGSAAPFTPGAANSLCASLGPFPPLWINELALDTPAGIADRFGDRDPWLELVNSSPQPVPLAGLYLADSYTDLTRWPFPTNATVDPGQFLPVWADAEPGESSTAELHTNFRLASPSGSLALVRIQNGAPAVIDYLDYTLSTPGTAFGALPDAQPFRRIPLAVPTPGRSNAATDPIALEGAGLDSTGTFRFSWASIPGVVYRVEAALEPSGLWTPIADIPAVTPLTTFTQTPPQSTSRTFYRVRYR